MRRSRLGEVSQRQPHKKKHLRMEPLFTNDLVHRMQLGTHSGEWALLQKGNRKSSCRGANENSFPLRIILTAATPARTVLSLPTTSRRLHRPKPPTGNSGKVRLSFRAKCKKSHVPRGRSWPEPSHRHKCCVNHWDPLNKLSPSTTISNALMIQNWHPGVRNSLRRWRDV